MLAEHADLRRALVLLGGDPALRWPSPAAWPLVAHPATAWREPPRRQPARQARAAAGNTTNLVDQKYFRVKLGCLDELAARAAWQVAVGGREHGDIVEIESRERFEVVFAPEIVEQIADFHLALHGNVACWRVLAAMRELMLRIARESDRVVASGLKFGEFSRRCATHPVKNNPSRSSTRGPTRRRSGLRPSRCGRRRPW